MAMAVGDRLNERLSSVEEDLVQLKSSDDYDRISQPAKLSAKLAELSTVPASAYATTNIGEAR